MSSAAIVWCAGCQLAADATAWRCSGCGRPLELRDPGVAVGDVLSLGEPVTPLLPEPVAGIDVLLKLEGALPTGSFKDRGAAVLVSWLVQHGAKTAVIDSSGNAGASLAAYCARAGLSCHLYAPAAASAGKLSQAGAYGAEVHLVPGSRQAVADAAMAAVANQPGAVYASHAWSPLFLAGTQTFAVELLEQLSGRAPDAVVVPVGAGTLLLGTVLGFARLRSAGLIETVPRVYGVQATGCAPLAAADAAGADDPAEVTVADTAAEGIRIVRPPRGRQVLRAVREAGGRVIAVDDDALWRWHAALCRRGVYPEPTAAVAVAGVEELAARRLLRPGETVVVPITGTGLKTGSAGRPGREG